MRHKRTLRITFLAIFIALNTVITAIFRVYGLAPFSSVMNLIGALMIGPLYTFIMALVAGILRILVLGSPIITLPGAVFGALLAAFFYKIKSSFWSAIFGEFIGTGLIGAFVSAWIITGSGENLFAFMPSFIAATVIGPILAYPLLKATERIGLNKRIREIFNQGKK